MVNEAFEDEEAETESPPAKKSAPSLKKTPVKGTLNIAKEEQPLEDNGALPSWSSPSASGSPQQKPPRRRDKESDQNDPEVGNDKTLDNFAEGRAKVSSQRTICIDDVPDQLLLLIFRHASRSSSRAVGRLSFEFKFYRRRELCQLSATAKSLIEMSHVCRRFRRLTSDGSLWSAVDLSSLLRRSILCCKSAQPILGRLHSLDSADFVDKPFDLPPFCISECPLAEMCTWISRLGPYIRDLNISGYVPEGDPDMWEELVKKCKSIYSLAMTTGESLGHSTPRSLFPRLSSLSLEIKLGRDHQFEQGSDLLRVVATLSPSLTSLTIIFYAGRATIPLSSLRALSCLEELCLNVPWTIDVDTSMILSMPPSLPWKSLDLNLANRTDKAVVWNTIKTSCPYLESLSLKSRCDCPCRSGGCGCNDSTVISLRDLPACLTYLCLEGLLLDPSSPDHTAGSSNPRSTPFLKLKALELAINHTPDAMLLDAIVKHFPGLTSLKLSFGDHFYAPALDMAMLIHLPALQHLSISKRMGFGYEPQGLRLKGFKSICTSLEDIGVFGCELEEGDETFSENSLLVSVKFRKCKGLNSLAFVGCQRLEKVKVQDIANACNVTVHNCPQLHTVDVNGSSRRYGEYAVKLSITDCPRLRDTSQRSRF